jgi:hypothetical protein
MMSKKLAIALLFSILPACGRGAKLPDGQESLNLSSAALNITMMAPPSGKVTKRSGIDGPEAQVTWGEIDKRAGGFTVSAPRIFVSKLACDTMDGPECKVVESDEGSVIKTLKNRGLESTWFRVHVKSDQGNIDCHGDASSLDNAKRLRDACKTAKATGPLRPAASKRAAGSADAKSTPTFPPLEKKTFTDKHGKDTITYTIKVPTDWSTEQSVLSRMFLDPAAKSKAPKAARSAVSIMVGGYSAVKDLNAAEKFLKQEDAVGLDTFAKKEVLPSKAFYFETAPRGLLKLVTVTVIAKGKKHTGRARCSGPASALANLREVCSSLTVE